MNIETLTADSLPAGLTAVGVPVVSVDSGPRPVAGTGQVAGAPIPTAVDPEWCKRHGFSAKVGQTLTFRASGPTEGPEVVLVGLGTPAMMAGDHGLESLRRAAAAFVRAVGQGETAALLLPSGTDLDPGRAGAAVAEGAVLASYRYDAFRTGDVPGTLTTLAIVPGVTDERPAVGAGAARGRGWPPRWGWPATWSTSHRAPSPPRSSPASSSSGSPRWTG